MASRRRPDGFVCGSASAAISAITAAEDQGFMIGRDFDVAVKESFNLMRKFRREIEVVHEDFRRAGKGLAEAVVRTHRRGAGGAAADAGRAGSRALAEPVALSRPRSASSTRSQLPCASLSSSASS